MRDRRLPTAVFLVSFVAAAAIAFMTGELRTGSVDQPIAFSHRRHVIDNQLSCSTCHWFSDSERSSGFPDAEVCSTCHASPRGKSAEEAKLVTMLNDGKSLVWNSVYREPVPAFFPHRRHVVKGKLECAKCHRGIEQATFPPRAAKPLRMSDCIACHEELNVSIECTACHR